MANRLRPETDSAALNHGERRTRRMPSRRRRKGAQGREPLRVVVVGASLSGLMTALAISRAGMSVTMLERTGRFPRTGAAVGLSVTVLGRLAHLEGSASIPSAFSSSPTLGATWSALHDRLRAPSRLTRGLRCTTRRGCKASIRTPAEHGPSQLPPGHSPVNHFHIAR